MAVVITDANHEEMANKGQLLVVDFWAQWCGPCRSIAPIVEELATEFEGKAIIGKVDVDDNPDIVSKFGIRNIPTIIFIKNGEMVDKVVGAVPKNELLEKINANL
jgi:thioredoxin 1